MSDANLVVRYRNAINRAAHFLDVIEQRIILTAIAQVPAGEVTDEKLYSVSASDLVELGSNQTKVYGQMKDAVKSLFDRYLTLTVEDGKRRRTRYFRWVQTVDYADNEARIYLRFSKDLLPFISDIQQEFTRFNLIDLAGIRSTYAIRLYSLLMQFRDTGKLVIKVDDLRQRFELGDKLARYNHLKTKVINLAVNQINEGERTQIKVSYKEKKVGRKVDTLIFTFKFKNAVLNQDGSIAAILPDEQTGDLFAGGYSDEQLRMKSLVQREFFADLLLGKSEKAKGFYEDCRKKKLLNWQGWATAQCRADLVTKLEDVAFVRAIFDPWLKLVGYHPSGK